MIDWTAIAAISAAASPLGALIGTFAGFRFASRNDEAKDQRAVQREAAARRAILAERLEEERHAFQRDTLLELQDVLLDLSRWSGLVADADVAAVKQYGKPVQLPDDLGGNTARLKVAVAQKLRSRVLDADLRVPIGDFIGDCTAVSASLGGLDRDAAIKEIKRRDDKAAAAYDPLAERIGEHLRVELDRRILVDQVEPLPQPAVRRRRRRG